MLDRPRRLLLSRWSRFVCNRPWWVLACGAVLAVASVLLAVLKLDFQSDRNDLLSRDLEWNQRYLDYRQKFTQHSSIVVVVRVPQGETGRQRAERFVEQVAEEVDADAPGIRGVWWGFSTASASPALVRIAPMEEFQSRLQQMRMAQPLLSAANISDWLEAMPSQMAAQQQQIDPEQGAEQIKQITNMVQSMRRVLAGELESAGQQPTAAVNPIGGFVGETWQYLASEDGELLFVEVEVEPVAESVNPMDPAVQAAREALRATQAKFPGIEAGLTGLPVIEGDETRISMRDSTICTMVAAVAIAVLMVIAFHNWQLPVLMVLSLAMGVAWSFGFLTLAVGHLQVLSVVFTVILLGLGIDFGIHLVSRFELVRHDYAEGGTGFCAAMTDTLHSAGPGIITGAFTAAIAFGTTLLTEFKGMAEMGLIAGVGVLLCLLAMLSVLPSLMRLLRPKVQHVTPLHLRKIDLHRREWLMPLLHHPVLTLVVTGVILMLSFAAMTRIRYDNNLLNLLPGGLDSVYWQEQVLDHTDTAVWYAAGVTDSLEEAERLAGQFRRVDSVDSLGGIGRLYPPDEPERLELILQTRQQLDAALGAEGAVLDQPGSAEQLRQTLQSLRNLLNMYVSGQAQQNPLFRGLGALLGVTMPDEPPPPQVRDALRVLLQELDQTMAVMQIEAFQQSAQRRLARLHEMFAALQDEVRRQIEAALVTRDLRPEDMPAYLRRHAVSRTEPPLYQLQIYPKHNVWDPTEMKPFIGQIRAVAEQARADDEDRYPYVTGAPVQIYESGLLMQRSYQLAGVLALIVVFALTYFDFLRLLDAVLCLLPVTVAFIVTFAAMWMFGWVQDAVQAMGWGELPVVRYLVNIPMSLNPANIMALPLMFGIGVASGVHVMHRYQQAPRRRPPGLTAGTGKGVILTSFTTIIAFASMLIAQHRGIRSLGFLLAVGIALTLVACLTLMPAVLELRNRYHITRRLRQWQRIGRDAAEARSRSAESESA